jgi:ATP adenylyltransferase
MGSATAGKSGLLERGALRQAVRQRTAHALACGALRSLPTHCEVVEQDGIEFAVRSLGNLERKELAGRAQERTGRNPFLPYEKDLFVADLSQTHLCLLNKFNVLDLHLLIVTRAFEEQESLLTPPDFEALWSCMAEIDGLGFYNAGAVAGASQRHKHLQLVSFPLGAGPGRMPIDSRVSSAGFDGPLGRVPGLPFVHALARCSEGSDRSTAEVAESMQETYLAMRVATGIDAERRPYNLLVTREWMLLVPRSRAAFASIEVNALGFAGALLVRGREQLETLRQIGPMTLLRNVAETATN